MHQMPLTPEELDALLTFLDHQWLPDLVQQAYDKLDLERRNQQAAETRLSNLERRLREAAEHAHLVPQPPAQDEAETDAALPKTEDR